MAFTCHREGGQSGALAFQQVAHSYVECEGTFMNERKRDVGVTFLVGEVLVHGNFGLLSHFGHRKSGDLAHLSDTMGKVHKVGSVYLSHDFYLR